jgi:hypothetical protein
MRAPLYRRTEKIGACLADPLADGEGAEKIDTFTIPDGGRRRVYRPCSKFDSRRDVLSIMTMLCCIFRLAKAAPVISAAKRAVHTGANRVVPFLAKTQYDRAHIGRSPEASGIRQCSE